MLGPLESPKEPPPTAHSPNTEPSTPEATGST
jgi:hypothetical protein